MDRLKPFRLVSWRWIVIFIRIKSEIWLRPIITAILIRIYRIFQTLLQSSHSTIRIIQRILHFSRIILITLQRLIPLLHKLPSIHTLLLLTFH